VEDIDLAEGRDKWRVVVNALMNFQLAELLANQGLCFMELVNCVEVCVTVLVI
jgi:hypothetical protein